GLLIFSLFWIGHVNAEENKNWEFEIAPFYLWAVNMDGDLTTMGNTSQLQMDFGQITDTLEGLFTVHFEGMNKNNWGFLVDISYINLNDQQTTPGPTMDVDFTTVMTEAAGIYKINYGANSLDLIGGIRYYSLDTEIDVAGAPPRVDKNKDWVDAMAGVRYNWRIADKWGFMARGDLGLGGSDLAWNLAGIFEYQPWKHASFIFGYRYMDIDYDDGSGNDLFRYDVAMHGPLLGINFKW
ncbi:MAG: hypothetical protein GY696_00075, partial [Gammaproteobacteria bacterium]|nr:hypothetical protein [Gammaproteobacteria bacterium]